MTHDDAIHYLEKIEDDYPQEDYIWQSIQHAISVIQRTERVAYTLKTKGDFNVAITPSEAKGLARILMLETGID